MRETSLLMLDSSEKDGNIETMLDYVLSWTLRRAEYKYSNEDTLLYGYCRDILFKLLEKEDYENIKVKSVETWKQWEKIDLHANIELLINGESEWHAILIENKGYGPLRENQLEKYKKIFDETYSKMPLFNDNLHYALITCHEDKKVYECDCSKHDFKLYSVSELQNTEAEETESDIFNEFWLRPWYA